MKKFRYEPIDVVYAKQLLPIWSDEDVIRYTNIKSPRTLNEIIEKIEMMKEFAVFVVIRDEEVIGIIGCPCISKEKKQYGLFYQFRKSVWGQGCASIAVEWLIDHIHKVDKGSLIYADVLVDNVASERILMKFGFRFLSEEDYTKMDIKSKLHHYILQV